MPQDPIPLWGGFMSLSRSRVAVETLGFRKAFSVRALIAFACLFVFAASAYGAIPDAERQVLLNIFNSTNGSGRTNKTGWTGASGTECSWHGVYFNGDHVTAIDLSSNNLTGSLPDLTGLSSLTVFEVHNNQLTGNPPAVPNPNALAAGGSSLCPNDLNPLPSTGWDAATGQSPWYATCTTYGVTYSGNGNTGGSAPVDPNEYHSGATVTVLGNTGALYRMGYAFSGWNTLPGGGGSFYAGGDTLSIGTDNVTLYANLDIHICQPSSRLDYRVSRHTKSI